MDATDLDRQIMEYDGDCETLVGMECWEFPAKLRDRFPHLRPGDYNRIKRGVVERIDTIEFPKFKDNPLNKIAGTYTYTVDLGEINKAKVVADRLSDLPLDIRNFWHTVPLEEEEKVKLIHFETGEERTLGFKQFMKFIENEMGGRAKSLAQSILTTLPPHGEHTVEIEISTKPLDIVGKSTGQGWKSCETMGHDYDEGVIDDITEYNAVVIVRTAKKGREIKDRDRWFSRTMLRWCEVAGETRVYDVGIEPVFYGGHYKINKFVEEQLEKLLEENGFLNYEACVTPYDYRGYSDQRERACNTQKGVLTIPYGPDAKHWCEWEEEEEEEAEPHEPGPDMVEAFEERLNEDIASVYEHNCCWKRDPRELADVLHFDLWALYEYEKDRFIESEGEMAFERLVAHYYQGPEMDIFGETTHPFDTEGAFEGLTRCVLDVCMDDHALLHRHACHMANAIGRLQDEVGRSMVIVPKWKRAVPIKTTRSAEDRDSLDTTVSAINLMHDWENYDSESGPDSPNRLYKVYDDAVNCLQGKEGREQCFLRWRRDILDMLGVKEGEYYDIPTDYEEAERLFSGIDEMEEVCLNLIPLTEGMVGFSRMSREMRDDLSRLYADTDTVEATLAGDVQGRRSMYFYDDYPDADNLVRYCWRYRAPRPPD